MSRRMRRESTTVASEALRALERFRTTIDLRACGPTVLLSALRQTAHLLDARHEPWALVGGLAVSTRVEPHFTRDIDLAVAVASDAVAESLVADQQPLGRLAAVRLLPPGQPAEGIVIDLLFTSSGIEPEICREADLGYFTGVASGLPFSTM